MASLQVETVFIDGIPRRKCLSGDSCRNPRRHLYFDGFMPMSEFHRSKGGYKPRCGPCLSDKIGYNPYLPVSRYKRYFDELVRRVGITEAARLSGISYNALQRICKKRQNHIQQKTLEKLMIALRGVREQDLVRHKKSIHYGATIRGVDERTPRDEKDFYSYVPDFEVGFNSEL